MHHGEPARRGHGRQHGAVSPIDRIDEHGCVNDQHSLVLFHCQIERVAVGDVDQESSRCAM